MVCFKILEVLMVSLFLSYNNDTKPAMHYLQLHVLNHLFCIDTCSDVIRRLLKFLKQNTDCEKGFFLNQYKRSFYSPAAESDYDISAGRRRSIPATPPSLTRVLRCFQSSLWPVLSCGAECTCIVYSLNFNSRLDLPLKCRAPRGFRQKNQSHACSSLYGVV